MKEFSPPSSSPHAASSAQLLCLLIKFHIFLLLHLTIRKASTKGTEIWGDDAWNNGKEK